jgi:hypothetical protein
VVLRLMYVTRQTILKTLLTTWTILYTIKNFLICILTLALTIFWLSVTLTFKTYPKKLAQVKVFGLEGTLCAEFHTACNLIIKINYHPLKSLIMWLILYVKDQLIVHLCHTQS